MPSDIEVIDASTATVGAFTVRRALPRRRLRTVGAWCFADHMGPAQVTETAGLDVGPHPHAGLQTVTWLMEGEVLHRDSLGSEQLIRPGQLNLMTAGRGVVHSEEATGTYRGTVHGVQLWVAQPAAEREGPADFAHLAELPRADVDRSTLTVIAGSFADVTSPARFGSELVGVEAVLRPGTSHWRLRPDFEYAVIALEGSVQIADAVAVPGQLATLGRGRTELDVSAREASRVLLLGGVPFPDPRVMWWNFVAGSREEITEAVAQWRAGGDRFGEVASRLPRIPSPSPPWLQSARLV